MSFSAHAGEPSLAQGGKGAAVGAGAHPVGTIGWQAPELISLRGLSGPQRQQQHQLFGTMEDLALEEGEEETSRASESQSQPPHMPDAPSSSMGGTSEPPSSSRMSAPFTPAPRTRFRPQQVDVFSLGCVFHYVLSGGQHPFGQWYEREANIVLGKPDLSQLQQSPDALDLISRMIAKEPRERPSARQVCHHPFFWSAQKRLDFFVQLSDRLEMEPPDAPPVLQLETDAFSLLGRFGWDRYVIKVLYYSMHVLI